ncbi:rod shape-determining protein MreD [Alphaproteobacteria bacterium KMM 3653]|uniref:Rod shape-determining protein MreD n=1 Tax=Harenicola maris TaxID=2841044 RepID=A0AAP2CUU0_9RHOB|nr:rod shape-determining protein MreD [Harenicola maris]
MIDPVTLRIFGYRALFAAVVMVLAFGRMLPLDMTATNLPGPDLITALAMAWVLRRPAYVPAGLILIVFLICDMLFQQPPGLWTMLVLLATEFLRARQALSRELPFPLEWGLVALLTFAMISGHQMMLGLFAVDRPALKLALVQGVFTLVAYPVVVFMSRWAMGLRKATPGEADALGSRL